MRPGVEGENKTSFTPNTEDTEEKSKASDLFSLKTFIRILLKIEGKKNTEQNLDLAVARGSRTLANHGPT